MQFRNYERSILVSIPVALMLGVLYLLMLRGGGFAQDVFGALSLPVAMTSTFGMIVVVSALVSGASYIGRAIDAILQPQQASKIEGSLTILGVVVGVALSSTLLLGGFSVPFFEAIPIFPQLAFVMTMIGSCAGLLARIGRVIDRKVMIRPVVDIHCDDLTVCLGAKSDQFAPPEFQFKPTDKNGHTHENKCFTRHQNENDFLGCRPR